MCVPSAEINSAALRLRRAPGLVSGHTQHSIEKGMDRRERIPCFEIDFAAWLVPVAANVSASSSRDSIATAGAETVNGYFMDVAHCHQTAEDIFGPDTLQLREIAPADTGVLHHLDSRLALPAIDSQFHRWIFLPSLRKVDILFTRNSVRFSTAECTSTKWTCNRDGPFCASYASTATSVPLRCRQTDPADRPGLRED